MNNTRKGHGKVSDMAVQEFWRLTSALIMMMSVACMASNSNLPLASAPQNSGLAASEASVPAFHEVVDSRGPLPTTVPAMNFPRGSISKAYEIAAAIPSVLAQQPCYCRCDRRAGHTGLLDCFTSSHGAECDICLREALFVGLMTEQGKSAQEIRSAIIRGEWASIELDRGSSEHHNSARH